MQELEPPPNPPSGIAKRVDTQPVPQWARELVRWTDTAIRIPGTNLTIGLDAILGFLLPAAGDTVTAIGSLSLFSLAVRLGVPKVVLGRMLINVAIDSIVGSIPILGDAFDVVFRANKKNLELIERYRQAPGAPAKPFDYVVVGLTFVILIALLALPIVASAFLIAAVIRVFHG
jgi:hypothetical protein